MLRRQNGLRSVAHPAEIVLGSSSQGKRYAHSHMQMCGVSSLESMAARLLGLRLRWPSGVPNLSAARTASAAPLPSLRPFLVQRPKENITLIHICKCAASRPWKVWQRGGTTWSALEVKTGTRTYGR